LLGGAVGEGLFKKIQDGYTVVARSFEDGDNIFLFGFSRGAYTARSLAGMIAVCGLPGRGKFTDQATLDAFNAYRDVASRKTLLDAFFKKYDAHAVKIAVVGVWDTVGALGIPDDLFVGLNTRKFGFLDTALHPDVQSAFHALSIDERRSEFAATLWDKPVPGQQIEQVWFPGVHSDVGGGYGQTGLSDIAMGWMMKNAADRGLVFDPSVYARYTQLDPKHALDQMHSASQRRALSQRARLLPTMLGSGSIIFLHTDRQTFRPAFLRTSVACWW
jgi:uncharacterized protein (DUF2235 family)